MQENNRTKLICSIIATVPVVFGIIKFIDNIEQRKRNKKEAEEKKKREAEEKKRNQGITDEEKHVLDLKAREMDLINQKKVEGFEAIKKAKRQYEEEKEPSSEKLLRSVRERICRILHLDEYHRPEDRPMLEDDEKTDERVYVTPLVGNLIKLGDSVVVAGISGAGKTIFVDQLADDISNGNVSKLLPVGSDSIKPQLTFLFDKELESDDRKERMGRKQFSSRLHRMNDPKFPSVYCLLDDLNDRVSILNEDATFIYDNLKSICGEPTSEQVKHLFDGLKEIQGQAIGRGIRITIIFVTHLVKDVSGLPEMADIAGAANITRFSKNVICLSSTKDDDIVIMNNPKLRHSKKNTPVILKRFDDSEDNPMIHFKYVGSVTEDEADAIIKGAKNKETVGKECYADGNKQEKYSDEVQALIYDLRQNKKLSLRDISKTMKNKGISMSHTTVSNILKEMGLDSDDDGPVNQNVA